MANILVTEDDPSIQDLLKSFFESEGFGVFLASDGTKALEIIKEKQIDLVISDVEMEPMDGVALLQTLRNEKNGVPFVMITGHPDIEIYIKAIHELGAFEYVLKPIDLNILLSIANRLIKRDSN